jgi:predicted ATPase/DNA-binding SARP family transcriptional activator
MSSKVTYRQQYTRCGKERCRKCKEGTGHGPYWYAYWSEGGRTISKYVGINLPANIEIEKQTGEEKERKSGRKQAVSPVTPYVVSPYALTEKGAAADEGTTQLQAVPFQLPTQVLRVYVLGQFRVERLRDQEWSAVVNRTWYRRRARALLGCLLSNPGRRLGREQVMEALWPDLDIDTAANRLNGAVHELRQILEPEIIRPAASRMLRLERDILELADRTQIWVDADAFEQLLSESNSLGLQRSGDTTATNMAPVEHLLEEAATLYVGDYLMEELYSEWSTSRREALRRHWVGSLLKLSELREARGALSIAMEPLNRLLASDPTDETAVQRLMILLTQLDRRGEALHTYRRLATRLQRTYESEPLPETRDLYEKLRLGRIHKIVHPKLPLAQAETVQKNTTPLQVNNSAKEKTAVPAEQPQAAASQDEKETIIAQAVTSIVGTSQFARYNQSPLVGRARELNAMSQLLVDIDSIENVTGNLSKNLDEQTHGVIENKQQRAIGNKRLEEQKHPHLVLLMGEAGIGKTRLAEELSHEAHNRGWAIAWTRAYEQEGAVPYRPWIELLRTFLQNIPANMLIASIDPRPQEKTSGMLTVHHTPTILERLSTLLPELRDLLAQNDKAYPPLPPEQERLHLWEATLGLLSALSKTTPLLLVLDDLHWTDGSSRELLAYLIRHIQDQRILLVGTCRDVELAPNDGLRTLIADLRREQAIITLPIHPLTQSQIGSLVSHLPQNIVQSIQTRAGGNPFFAEELARVSETSSLSIEPHLTEMPINTPVKAGEGRHDMFHSSATGTLPEGIAAVLERRLGKLSGECLNLLGKAAVLGGAFEFDQLLYMANERHEDAILDMLEEALRAGLLTEEGTGARITYHFWHPLIVSHLYDHLSATRCAQLHRRAADGLLREHQGHENEVAAAITHHLSKGGSDPAQIGYYAELAGSQAYSLAAFAEAQQYYLLAVETLAHGKLPIKELGSETILRTLNTVLADIPNPLHIARLLERACECGLVQGDYQNARHFYHCILALRNQQEAGTEEDCLQREAQIQALIWREIGRTWYWNGDLDQAYECYQRGQQVMEDAGVTSGAALACIQVEYGAVNNLRGNYDSARRYVLDALERFEQAIQERQAAETDSSKTLSLGTAQLGTQANTMNVASTQQKNGYTGFQTITERAIMGDPLEVGRAHEMLGIISAHVGQYAESLIHFQRALTIYEQHDLVIAMVKVCGNIGAVYLTRSEHVLADTYMRRALDLAERMGSQPIIALVSGNLGEKATRTGKLLQAEEWFRRSLTVSERINEPEHSAWCNVALAGTLQDQGQLQEAGQCIRRSLALSRGMKSNRGIGGALVALGDFRVVQAIVACKLQEPMNISEAQHAESRRLLLRAKATLQRAITIEGLETESVIEGQLTLASVYFLLDETETAYRQAIQTLEGARTHELTRMLARSQRLLGRILAVQGEYEQSDTYFELALQTFYECEMRLEYARALHGYGIALLDRGLPGEGLYNKGLTYLQEARTLFTDCHADIDLLWVDRILNDSEPQTVEMQ